jgi:hypothetical protein
LFAAVSTAFVCSGVYLIRLVDLVAAVSIAFVCSGFYRFCFVILFAAVSTAFDRSGFYRFCIVSFVVFVFAHRHSLLSFACSGANRFLVSTSSSVVSASLGSSICSHCLCESWPNFCSHSWGRAGASSQR